MTSLPSETAAAARLSTRAREIEPFYAVSIFREAVALAATGRSIILTIGEPDFPTPDCVIAAATAALRQGKRTTSSPWGITPLREAIARQYAARYGVQVPVERIAATVGASGALALVFATLADPGDEILMGGPGIFVESGAAHVLQCARAIDSRGSR